MQSDKRVSELCYTNKQTEIITSFIYKFSLSLIVSNKRQNCWTDRVQTFCRTSRDPREGLWMIKIEKNLCLKVFYFCKIFLKAWKSAIFFINPRIFFFFNVYNEIMFTIEILFIQTNCKHYILKLIRVQILKCKRSSSHFYLQCWLNIVALYSLNIYRSDFTPFKS